MSLFPEYYAREVRHKLGLSGPIDVTEVATDLGVDVYEEDLDGPDGVLKQPVNLLLLSCCQMAT
jgi:hypothetical protein